MPFPTSRPLIKPKAKPLPKRADVEIETPEPARPTKPKGKLKEKRRLSEDTPVRMFKVDAREEVDEDGVIHSVKPSKRRDVAVVPPSRPPSLATAKQIQASLRSRFGEKADLIVEQLEHGAADGSVSLISRSLLQMLVGLLPIQERYVQESNGTKGVYQLVQVSSQIRELLTDLQAVRDKGLLGHQVVERIVRPSYQDLASQIVVAFINIEASARGKMSREDFKAFQADLSSTRTGLANYLTRMYDDIQKGVIESLS